MAYELSEANQESMARFQPFLKPGDELQIINRTFIPRDLIGRKEWGLFHISRFFPGFNKKCICQIAITDTMQEKMSPAAIMEEVYRDVEKQFDAAVAARRAK